MQFEKPRLRWENSIETSLMSAWAGLIWLRIETGVKAAMNVLGVIKCAEILD